MNNNKNITAKLRNYLITGVLTIAVLGAMIGVYRNTDSEIQGQTQVAQGQTNEVQEQAGDEIEISLEQTGEQADSGAANGVEYEDYSVTEDASAEKNILYRDGVTVDKTANVENESEQDIVSEDGRETEQAVETSGSTLKFEKSSRISWPVSGNVIMNYSMDKTVYFATLDQYRYNPAIIVEADVNTKVLAGAAGTITSIETNENTGTTVTMDLGSGYQAIYGQLKEVRKQTGDTVSAEDVLGYVAEPTKYYSVEGSNLYFAMTKDGEPVNPMLYLK